MLGVTLFGIVFTPVFSMVICWLTGRGQAATVPTMVPVGLTAIQGKPGRHDV
jgi:hypothetical protein